MISSWAWPSVCRGHCSFSKYVADLMPYAVRNTYTLFDYGDWVSESQNDRQDPYIQLLSVTNKTKAHEEFVQIRLNGVDSTGDPSHALLPPDQCKKSPLSPGEKKKM